MLHNLNSIESQKATSPLRKSFYFACPVNHSLLCQGVHVAELSPGKTCRKEPPASSELRHEACPHLSACGDIHTWWVKSLFILSYYGLLIQNWLNKIFCSVCKSIPDPEFVFQEEQEPRQWLSLRATSLCLKGPPLQVKCNYSSSGSPLLFWYVQYPQRAPPVTPETDLKREHPGFHRWAQPSWGILPSEKTLGSGGRLSCVLLCSG